MSDPVAAFATVDPVNGMTGRSPGQCLNLVHGEWNAAGTWRDDIVDPLNGEHFLEVPDTRDAAPFLQGLISCPKSGLHNPFKNTERYVLLGKVCARAAASLAEPAIEEFFVRLVQRVMPKSRQQCVNEVIVTRVFLENFSGDGVRFLGRGFSNPGDRTGQESRGYRWPYGPVVVIAPFNFPLEIPALQALGALFMDNRPLVKVDSKVSIVFEQFLRLLIHCGLPPGDIDLIHCRGERMGNLIHSASEQIRMIQFTGSSTVAESVSASVNGRVRIEDAGFDWKVIGPDFDGKWLDYVAWQCDEDAYNAAGQKCSAQSLLLVHENWETALLPRLKSLAGRRGLEDLSNGPLLSLTNGEVQAHIDAVLQVPGSKLLFGGSPLQGHSVPGCYAAYEPTAVSVPLSQLQGGYFDVLTTELFGPFQIVASYSGRDLPQVLQLLEDMSHHLTAAVVSADVAFQNRILAATVNGTTYCGMRARTTGAPQNHWFGPCGDPRAAGIGTPEAIISTWSGHREIVFDEGDLTAGWTLPALQ